MITGLFSTSLNHEARSASGVEEAPFQAYSPAKYALFAEPTGSFEDNRSVPVKHAGGASFRSETKKEKRKGATRHRIYDYAVRDLCNRHHCLFVGRGTRDRHHRKRHETVEGVLSEREEHSVTYPKLDPVLIS